MSADEGVLVAVIALRLLVPLLIPAFPLPAILACLVIDAADQSVFQKFTDLDLDGYQGYDKALDIYYLAIAYLSTIRNWADPFAFAAVRFLWYYRLSGVLLFEAFDNRAILLIFPNTFEYVFIAYEAVRLRWDPRRLDHRHVVVLVAAIWIFIKLPQEWWLHVAQLDFTDFMREDVFGVPLDTSWSEAISQNLWFLGLLAVLVAAVAFGGGKLARRLPPPDWRFSFSVDAHPGADLGAPTRRRDPAILSWRLLEKCVLVTMVLLIFAMVLPGSDVSALGIATPVVLLIIGNSLVSHWLASRGHTWSTAFVELLAMAAVNLGLALAFLALARRSDVSLNEPAALFFLLLLTLIVTLFDRFQGEAARDRQPLAPVAQHGGRLRGPA